MLRQRADRGHELCGIRWLGHVCLKPAFECSNAILWARVRSTS